MGRGGGCDEQAGGRLAASLGAICGVVGGDRRWGDCWGRLRYRNRAIPEVSGLPRKPVGPDRLTLGPTPTKTNRGGQATMSITNRPDLITPHSGQRIRTGTPVFAWEGVDATEYRIRIDGLGFTTVSIESRYVVGADLFYDDWGTFSIITPMFLPNGRYEWTVLHNSPQPAFSWEEFEIDATPEAETVAVDSSAVTQITWNDESIEVEFTSGEVYEYLGVSRAIFEEIISASSVGRRMHELVIGHYQYQRL